MAQIDVSNTQHSVVGESVGAPDLNVPFADRDGALRNDTLEARREIGHSYDRETGIGEWSVRVTTPRQPVGVTPRVILPLIEQCTGAAESVEGGGLSLDHQRLITQLLRPEFREKVWSNEHHRTKIQGFIRQDPAEAPNIAVRDYWKTNRFTPEQLAEIVRVLADDSYDGEVAGAASRVYALGESGKVEEARQELGWLRQRSSGEQDIQQLEAVFKEILGQDFKKWSETVSLVVADETSVASKIQGTSEKFYDALFVEKSHEKARQLLAQLTPGQRQEFIAMYESTSGCTLLQDIAHSYQRNEDNPYNAAAILLREGIHRTDSVWPLRTFRGVDYDKVALVINSATDQDLIVIANWYGSPKELLNDFDKHLPGHYEGLRLHRVLSGSEPPLELKESMAKAATRVGYDSDHLKYDNQAKVLETLHGREGRAAAELLEICRLGGDGGQAQIALREALGRNVLGPTSDIDAGKVASLVGELNGVSALQLSASLSRVCKWSPEADQVALWLQGGFNSDLAMEIMEQASGYKAITSELVGYGEAATWQKVYRADPSRLEALVKYINENPEIGEKFAQEKRKELRDLLCWVPQGLQTKRVDEQVNAARVKGVVELLARDMNESTRNDIVKIAIKDNEASLNGTRNEIEAGWQEVFGETLGNWARRNGVNPGVLFPSN